MIAEEIINKWKGDKEGGLLVKLDFEKAYDSVDHGFLNRLLEGIGFGAKWRGWMQECISTPLLSVLVDGHPTPQFGMEKGLRQGDPISPLLFNIIVEGLNVLLQRARHLGLIEGEGFEENKVHITHFQFADDTILFLKPRMEFNLNAKRVLRCFELASGFLLGGRPGLKNFWNPLVSKVENKLAHWKRKFYLKGFGKEGKALWRKVICSKYKLDEKSLFWNWQGLSSVSFLVKSMKVLLKDGSLTCRVIKDGFQAVVGCGDRAELWSDICCEGRPLKVAFPRCFALAIEKSGAIQLSGNWVGMRWIWNIAIRRPCFDWEKDQWRCFLSFLDCIKIRRHTKDSIAWSFLSNGIFSVGSCTQQLDGSYNVLEPFFYLYREIWVVSDSKVAVSWVDINSEWGTMIKSRIFVISGNSYFLLVQASWGLVWFGVLPDSFDWEEGVVFV
ncbi:hypothetical protein Ddye_015810 [Dipteronia dyeriana]|uniref:Reverse transcriptase domain-containing protein n=1 Tax=Dipteronia dyeriana TaxID=168575 RepID=A0AAD9U6A3_9ROSI|nr:hypothetical protein Ddye_015810 [Dipteronia dyeriana]